MQFIVSLLSDSSLHHIFASENLKFPFILQKNSLIWRVKCENLKLQRIVGNLSDKLRKLHMNGTAI